jgi:hypothetical protein
MFERILVHEFDNDLVASELLGRLHLAKEFWIDVEMA